MEQISQFCDFMAVDSSTCNFQQCTQLPEELFKLLKNPYSVSLEEYIAICISPKDNELDFLRSSRRVIARISAFTTNHSLSAGGPIFSDMRVREICVTESLKCFLRKTFPQLDQLDSLIACSIKDSLYSYFQQFQNFHVQIPNSVDPLYQTPVQIQVRGVIRRMTVTIIYKDLSKLGQFDQKRSNCFGKQLVRDAFKSYGIYVKDNTIVDLRDCPFLSGCPNEVSYIFVHECAMSSQADVGKVANHTEISIRRNHDLPYMCRILSTISGPEHHSLPGLEFAYSELSSAFQICWKQSQQQLKHCYSGILLGGPTGSGKRQLVSEVARRYSAKLLFYNMSVEEKLISQNPKAVVTKLSNIFHDAVNTCSICSYPVLVLLENMDVLRGSDTGGTYRKAKNKEAIVNHIVELLDQVAEDIKLNATLVVVATTLKPYLVPDKLRIGRRFGQEIFINIPDLPQRIEILKSLQNENPELSSINLELLARRTPGYVASDLSRLIMLTLLKAQEAAEPKEMDGHIKYAISRVLPSILQGSMGVIRSPAPEGLDCISGLETVKMNLIQTIAWPLSVPEALQRMGIQPARGIILYGPSGCGKTSLVRAIASSHHTNFISVSSAELFCSGVGDSEKVIAHLFHLARQSSPCVLFIDELDAIVGSREAKSSTGKPVNDMILSMLLTEMDGIGERNSFAKGASNFGRRFVVVGATNRPEAIDPALLRPGRFDRLVPVPPPNRSDRMKLLRNCTKDTNLTCDVEFEEIAEKTKRFSGADIINLCREAGLLALSEDISAQSVSMEHYRRALSMISPSISQDYLNSFNEYSCRNSSKTLSDRMSTLSIS